jgi:hypothetical protein
MSSMPNFTADAALSPASRPYRLTRRHGAVARHLVPQQYGCPPPGTCHKAYRYCRFPGESALWCRIADRCDACMAEW